VRRFGLVAVAGILMLALTLSPVSGADRDLTEVHLANGLVYYALGFTEMAVGELRRACELDPTNTDARIALGVAYHDRGEANGALQAYHDVLRIDGDSPYVHGLIGDVYRSQGDYERAKNHYLKAREDEELVAIPCYGLGVLAEEAQDQTSAMEYYREVLDAAPDHVDTALRLAGLLKETGDIDGALQVLTEANRYNPREPEIHYQWGLLYLQKEAYSEAFHEFDRVLQLQSGHPGAQQELRRLEQMLQDRVEPSSDPSSKNNI